MSNRPFGKSTQNGHGRPSAQAIIDAVAHEQFRVLAIKIGQLDRQRPTRILAVTSAIASEGKTTVATTLAMTLAKSFGKKTLLVDADFRRPGIASLLGMAPSHGLSEVLKGTVAPAQARYKRQDTQLTVMPLVRAEPDAVFLLSEPTGRARFQEATAGFDMVIVDAPPALPVVDAALIGELVDGFLLVVRAEQTPKRLIASVLKNIPREKVIGFVLNNSTAFGRSAHTYHYYGPVNLNKVP